MKRQDAIEKLERIREVAARAIADLREADAVLTEQNVSTEEQAAVQAEAAKIRAAHVGAAEERAKLIVDIAGELIGIDTGPITADPPPVAPPATDPPPPPPPPPATDPPAPPMTDPPPAGDPPAGG